ncbi:MAG TPA: TraR/DksA C4-type zinc finger protein [Streptosporangiaceae bacterium]|nr:TraR/DksA C4-type zinc finger protein [Streptosporangiaceae bacterium]
MTVAAAPPVLTRGAHWRALLEARWRARLQEITELSLAYHDEAGQRETQRLLRRTVATRRKLANVEEALGRLAAGTFGYCEQCAAQIPAGLLAIIPETRYCARCAAEGTPAPNALPVTHSL